MSTTVSTTFQLVSDLHFDYRTKMNPHYNLPEWKILLQRSILEPNRKSDTPADVLIMAGDISEIVDDCWLQTMNIVADHYEFVVVVLGNHEYYRTNRAFVRSVLDKLPGNVYHLECKHLDVGGIQIAGATLWFNDVESYNSRLKSQLSDFKCIHNFERWVEKANRKAVDFFGSSNADIFVSHHLPSPKSIDPKYLNDELNCFFVSDQTPLIERQKPKVWCHGHTHSMFDYMIGDTRILCNPFGYPAERKIRYPLCQFTIEKELEVDH